MLILKVVFANLFVTTICLTIIMFFGNTVFADNINEWKIKEYQKFVIASKSGKITYGEEQKFVFFRKNCTTVQHLFNIYTIKKNDFSKIKGNLIVLEFNGEKIGGKVLTVSAPPIGHILMIDLGIYNKDTILQHLQKNDDIRIRLVDGNDIVASEYFDILENEWSIKGIKDAFSEAFTVCKKVSPSKVV
tara:strand:- start:148 stop:714 length:567 start_codon:yes stop_codon:yes gene_type:complete